MEKIDQITGLDWSESKYVGDGVYVRSAADYMGIPSVAIRTDRGDVHHVIVMETDIFAAFVKEGKRIFAPKDKATTLDAEH